MKKFAESRDRGDAMDFLAEALKHCKAIGARGEAPQLLGGHAKVAGVVVGIADSAFTKNFIQPIAEHRHWARERHAMAPPSR